ncbi:glycoside hydrolase domain-containing protein [Leifsonia sp. McL0607]|uniref:glycoside hydrolase domain-containing protein n=1 Tax=Leifsonia sp. McL0607 TaxID=3415672 RepID=UPI003CF37088
MDLLVLQSQQWLNATYKGRSGFATITEDGSTGWQTMYALTRALQIELGISTPSDNFGPTTMSTLTSKFGTIAAGFTKNKNVVTILQCALWCKGYAGGAIVPFGESNPAKSVGSFTAEVGSAVASIRADMGLGSSPTVPPKVFKSLLNMDAYVAVNGGKAAVRTVQQFLNGTYWEREDFRIMPCDGHYSRDVQQGLMYAIQFGLGMADGTANGNFGPGTQSGLKSKANLSVGSSDDERRFVSLFQAALIFNGYDSDFTGKYSSKTQTAAKAFQSFCELPTHGSADFATWASLLVSTGDPDRPVTACDTDTPLTTATASLLYSQGFRAVGRYLNGPKKAIQAGELDVAFAAGLSVFPIYQEYNNLDELREYGAENFGYRQGRAAALRARQLGFVAGTTIYFPIDADATADEIDALVIPYFRGVNRGVALSSSIPYTVGCYGPRNVGVQVAENGLAATSFVAGLSTGWSANLGFALPKNWAYDQIKETKLSSGGITINIDRNAASTRAKPAGRASVSPTPLILDNYDTNLFWTFEEYCFQAEVFRAENKPELTNADLTQIVLNTLQRAPDEAGNPKQWTFEFQIYTPFLDDSEIGRARTAFERTLPNYRRTPMIGEDVAELNARHAALNTMLDSTGYDIAHFAASTRGYLQYGTYGGSPETQIGDLGAWALDLVQAWNAYERARVRGEAPDAFAWLKNQIGGQTVASDVSGFGCGDLIADIDAYLAAMSILDNFDGTRTNPKATLATTMREIWANAAKDYQYRRREFTNVRFNGNPETAKKAVRHLFTSDAIWVKGPSDQFLKVRRPGTTGGANPIPTAPQLAVELDQIAGAFAAVLFAGL